MIRRTELFIDGKWRQPASGDVVEVVCPSTEEVVATVPDAIDADVNLAVDAARRAFDAGPWRRATVAERVRVLGEALQTLESRIAEIAELVTTEMGMPISASTQVIPDAFSTARFFLDVAAAEPVVDVRKGSGSAAVIREPVGVVASFAPWNGPFSLGLAKIFAALVTGCSVVYKPAPEAPLDVFLVAESLDAAGLPAGAFNLLTGGTPTGQLMVAHPEIDMVSFTGSTAAGRQIGQVCGQGLKRMQLELGGKSAAIVLEDADMDTTLAALAAGSFFNSGQMCLAYSRVLAPASRYDEVVEALCATAESFLVGDPFDPATTMGPLASRRQRERVEDYIAVGLGEGAAVVSGGKRPDDLPRGWYVRPTVFAGVDNGMRIAQEEIFGPVVAVIPHNGIDHAIEIANQSAYGLHGGVFTADQEAALRCAREVRAGTFSINSFTYNTEVPFGGVKCSGIGRDTGREGVTSYYELKTVHIPETMEHCFS